MPDAPLNFELTKALEDHRAGLSLFTQQRKLSAELAAVVIRSMILVNGGAAIAILALVGHLWTADSDAARQLAVAMQPALACFGAALFLILLCAFLIHLAMTASAHIISHQLLGRRESHWANRHRWIRGGALAAGALSFAAFALGTFAAIAGMQ